MSQPRIAAANRTHSLGLQGFSTIQALNRIQAGRPVTRVNREASGSEINAAQRTVP
jgi:hypothetical protein